MYVFIIVSVLSGIPIVNDMPDIYKSLEVCNDNLKLEYRIYTNKDNTKAEMKLDEDNNIYLIVTTKNNKYYHYCKKSRSENKI